MSGERLSEKAVAAVVAWLSSQLQASLTAVESQRGMTAGSLPFPAEIVDADLPSYGGATPTIEVFETTTKTADPRTGRYVWDLSVIVTHASDADVMSGRRIARAYATAVVDCLKADCSLGSSGLAAIVSDISFAVQHGSTAKHLHHVAIGLTVEMFDEV